MTATQRHPWNGEFAWTDHEAVSGALTADQVRQFDEVGYVVVENVFDTEELIELRTLTDAAEAEVDKFLDTRKDGRLLIAEKGAITFAAQLASKSPALATFVRHERLVGLCRDLVGPDVRLYHDQAVYKKPEKPRRFPWHQDNGYLFVEPQQYLTCWIAVTDATVDNGCPQVVPRLHRGGTLAHTFVDPLGYECFSDPDGVEVAEVEAGGVVVFSSLTPHLTGPNTTGAVRKAYIVQYATADAEVLEGDPYSGPPTGRNRIADESRGFPVLRAGLPV